jgi:hypothetical protein
VDAPPDQRGEGPAETPLLEARELVGLLAEPDRLRVVAALALGASTLADIERTTGLDARGAVTALRRLVDGDLVVPDADGSYYLLTEAFRIAARAAAPAPAADREHSDAPPDAARVLRAFVRNGRLISIPAARSKRLVVLDLVAQEFEPGRRYSESTVNLILGRFHADVAALRRYLVDEGLMERERGEYWRTGGTFVP